MLTSVRAADRLVQVLAQDGGELRIDEAARVLLALPGSVDRVALDLVRDLVRTDARLARRGERLLLAPSPFADVPLGTARFAVLDLETQGGVDRDARIREIAVVVLDGGRTDAELGLSTAACENELEAVRRALNVADGCVLAGHNVGFDCRFVDRQLGREGERLAVPLVDTLMLARRLLADRVDRLGLSALADFFGTPTRPCHEALADARATAEILLRLIELAAEQGVGTVGDLCALSRPHRQVRAWR